MVVLRCKVYRGYSSIMDACPRTQDKLKDWKGFYDTAEKYAIDQQEQFHQWKLLVVTEKPLKRITQKS